MCWGGGGVTQWFGGVAGVGMELTAYGGKISSAAEIPLSNCKLRLNAVRNTFPCGLALLRSFIQCWLYT